jgi:tRNA1(Val) A37 N6-methylase TrmN6
VIATTQDTVYQGRVKLVQPLKGFRAGSDSLLLASALQDRTSGEALELGCGCGGALLPSAFRLPGVRFTGVEIDPQMAALAQAGISANGFENRVSVEAAEASDWVKAHENRFDLVFANPPYFEPGRISPPGEGKESAYLESLDLGGWIKAMVFAAKPRAPVVMVHRAAELARILTGFERQTGDITVLPIAAKPGEEARRVLVRGRKGLKRGPVRLLAPLHTHDTSGGPSEVASRVAEGQMIAW